MNLPIIPYTLEELRQAAKDCPFRYYAELMEWAIKQLESKQKQHKSHCPCHPDIAMCICEDK